MPPVLPPPPAATATPAHRPRPHTPPNCKDPELQALAPPRSPSAPPSSTSITPSPAPGSAFWHSVTQLICPGGPWPDGVYKVCVRAGERAGGGERPQAEKNVI
eukprot:COSAG06_NODE_829_length_12043_cov_8.656983_2_plen_103_part_00